MTDAETSVALSMIRSLGRAGYRVIAGSSRERGMAARSRHVAARIRYASPARDPAGFVEDVRDAIGVQRVDLVIPVTDATIVRLAAARSTLGSELAVTSDDGLETALSKRRTLELATRIGTPIPRTSAAHDAREALAAASRLGYPVVIKPERSYELGRRGALRSAVDYASSPGALVARLGRLAPQSTVLIQEIVSGDGVGIGMLARAGEPVLAFQHRRLREFPVSGGASAMRVSEALDPIMYRHATDLAWALSWTGLLMVEFKRGAAGPRLMEVNGRPWGSLPLAVAAGADFPRALADLYLGGRRPSVSTAPPYRIGVRGRNLERELRWVWAVARQHRPHPFLPFPPRHAALEPLGDLLRPRVRDDVLALMDPVPGLAYLAELARMLRRSPASP